MTPMMLTPRHGCLPLSGRCKARVRVIDSRNGANNHDLPLSQRGTEAARVRGPCSGRCNEQQQERPATNESCAFPLSCDGAAMGNSCRHFTASDQKAQARHCPWLHQAAVSYQSHREKAHITYHFACSITEYYRSSTGGRGRAVARPSGT